MYYLRCNHCGHLNEVKTEYLTLCEKCSHKMENNFREWQMDHPGKSFDDFKVEACLTKSQMANQAMQKEPKRKKGNFFLGFVLGFLTAALLFFLASLFLGSNIDKFMQLKEKTEQKIEEQIATLVFSEKTSKDILEKEWIKKSYGSLGLTIETPYPLESRKLEFPPETRALVKKMESYFMDSEKGVKVFINSALWKETIGQINLENGAQGSVLEMQKQKGVTDFTYNQEATSLGNLPGILQKGSYKTLGLEAEFFNVIYGEGLNYWQVTVLYQKNDEIGRQAAQRVLKSIEINH